MKTAAIADRPQRAVIYTRVSSQHQQDHGTSLHSQYEACKQYAKQHGFEIVAHDDEGVGDSMTQDRPALQCGLDRVKRKEADVFLCHDVDRLSRDVADQWDILRQVERAGGALHFVLLPPEDSDSWLILFAMKGVIGTIEKRTIKRRTSLGKHTATKQGKVLGGWMEPYGFRYVKGEARWEPIEGELLWVRKMFRWCLEERCTLGEIARRLNDAGVPTKRGRGLWQFTTVREMLINSMYAGQWYWNKTDQRGHHGKTVRPREEWIAIPVEPVVSESMIEAARAIMQQNRDMASRGCKREYVLRGLVFCSDCGYRMRGTNKAGRMCYRCNSRYNLQRHLALDDRCPNMGQFYCDEVDDLVWKAVVRALSEEAITETLQATSTSAQAGGPAEDISALEKQSKELVRRLENLYDLAEGGDIDRAVFRERKAKLDDRLAATQAALLKIAEREADKARALANMQTTKELCARVRSALPRMTKEGRREFYLGIGLRVLVSATSLHIEGLLGTTYTEAIPSRADRVRAGVSIMDTQRPTLPRGDTRHLIATAHERERGGRQSALVRPAGTCARDEARRHFVRTESTGMTEASVLE